MSKFNTKKEGKKILNYEGGTAYKRSFKNELVAHVLTSFVNNQFYRSQEDSLEDLQQLLASKYGEDNIPFVAKTALYARDKGGMRSISHILAYWIGTKAKGKKWTKRFFDKVIIRPDDMCEIIALFNINNKPIPNSLKKGFANAFNKFDEYQLAKYKGKTRKVSLVDVVNIVHPKGNDKNKVALAKLVNNTLPSFDTWESERSAIGQDGTLSVTEKEKKKAESWIKLISEGKLGYLAMLRNIAKIAIEAPSIVDLVCEQLTSKEKIMGSRVFPLHIYKAFVALNKIVIEIDKDVYQKFVHALDKAIMISCSNIKPLDGKVVILLDTSGSMGMQYYWNLHNTYDFPEPITTATLFAFSIAKNMDADIIQYNSDAKLINEPLLENTSILELVSKYANGDGGTNLPSAFKYLLTKNIKADYIIIISDEQSWMTGSFYNYNSQGAFNYYKKAVNPNAKLISIDMQGYSTTQLVEDDVALISGFGNNIYNVLNMVTQDKNALIKEIESITI